MARRRWTQALVAALVGTGSACAPAGPGALPSPLAFTTHQAASIAAAAFVEPGDVLPGGGTELVVSAFGTPALAAGSVSILQHGSDLDTWNATTVVPAAAGVAFPNDPTLADLNGDGRVDVIVPGGFFLCNQLGTPCGSLSWWEQNADRTFARHDIMAPGQTRFFHRALLNDVDGDGVSDLVTVGETFTDSLTMWFRGDATPGNPRFEPVPRVVGPGGGSLPTMADVDGDGDTDIVSGSLFGGSWFMWHERTGDPSPSAPGGTWAFHTIATGLGAGFSITRVPNLHGDGVDRWIGTNHVNPTFGGGTPGVYRFDLTGEPTSGWTPTLLSSGITSRAVPGQASPGGFGWGDIDDDGRTDFAVSGDGDDRVFWLQQQPDRSFVTYVLDSGMGQAGGVLVVDLDGDGINEVVFSSYEAGVVRVYTH